MLYRIYTIRNTATGATSSIDVQGRDAIHLCDVAGAWYPLSRPRAARALRFWHRAAGRDARYSLEVVR